jgi:hypothetical protein
MPDYHAILSRIQSDARYQKNIQWGEPRHGHPEGSIAAHIQDLEKNLERLRARLSEEQYGRLKILIHVHDTFKPDAAEGSPIHSPGNHASLARQFLAEFCAEADLLEMVQWHDESYALYQRVRHKRSLDWTRFRNLLSAVQDWDTFLAFLIIDNGTSGKSAEPLQWFFRLIEEKVTTQWSAKDIIDRRGG